MLCILTVCCCDVKGVLLDSRWLWYGNIWRLYTLYLSGRDDQDVAENSMNSLYFACCDYRE